MGDPLSPGMCILTCGWMEGEWLAPIPPSERELFRAARYMDDIIMFISSKLNKLFHSSVKNECYWPPLKLEEGSGDTFLETFFRKLPGGAITFRLKNVNEEEPKVWRYHHYLSALDYATKRGVLASTLLKVEKMASDPQQLRISALAKCTEFLQLGYPMGIIKYLCGNRARESGYHTSRCEKNTVLIPRVCRRVSARRSGARRSFPLAISTAEVESMHTSTLAMPL